MGILVECSVCKLRGGLKRKLCKCGHNVQKAESKNYWIEYYKNGKRVRERIGRSKQSAESFLNHYESGDKIWSFNNAPSKPGNLGWEYGVLILNSCNIKYVQPIIVS